MQQHRSFFTVAIALLTSSSAFKLGYHGQRIANDISKNRVSPSLGSVKVGNELHCRQIASPCNNLDSIRDARTKLTFSKREDTTHDEACVYPSLSNFSPFKITALLVTSVFAIAASPLAAYATDDLLIAADNVQEWRQYVPLIVSCLVIVDILLGSPLANIAMAPMRQGAEEESDEMSKKKIDTSNERVDTEKLAREALDKAENAQELRDYLERNKTEKDRMEDIRKKIDRQLSDLE
mmetsp:Transcript_24583/g.36079  ORF Transcript_24583/g.36079 Transcript_24583/m.36079 type:complete len:237 (+) Transcript_24583:52-762(+)